MPFFQISLINSQLKTTYNIFRTLSDILSRNSYIMPITRPYSLWNMRNYMYLWILKSYSVVSKKYSPHAVFQTLQTRKNDLSKTFRLTSLQKPTLQPVQSSVSLSICAFFCISYAIYFFSVLSGYFYVSLNLRACSQCLNMTHPLWSLALKMGFEAPSFGHLYCFYSWLKVSIT